jgi:uncharacterized protein (DUF58 family)
MSATRRAYAVFGVCLLALAAGSAFGARALNAIVVPGLVALAAGWIGTRRATPPTVTRSQPSPGFPGDERTIALDIDADRSTAATVYDRVGSGLSASAGRIETAVPGRVEYDCRLDERGEHALGPVTVTVEDALGLFARNFRSSTTTGVLVYPSVRRLSDRAHQAFLAGGEDALLDDRGEFDSLREYVPGDPLRDVHWKSSAKQDEFVVTEFAPGEDEEGLTVVAEAASGEADAMATATATIACWLLDAGVEIDLVTPDGRLPGASPGTREGILALLARAGAGRVSSADREGTDVSIRAERDGVTVEIGGSTFAFDRLVDSRSTPRGSPTGTVLSGAAPPDRRPGTRTDSGARAATDGGSGGRP